MPAKTSSKPGRLALPRHAVTVVLVSHDGARWLPETLAALGAQTRPPQRVVAVDTGSTDGSADLLSAALGASAVVGRSAGTGLGPAIQAGLDAFTGAPPPPGVDVDATEWLWVLHDDSAPDPDALERLLERADESPSLTVIGPKIVSWDRRRLLEVGVTTDGSGHRDTGLDAREVDQGQHDSVGDVLAVSTAGMLVRRAVWDRLGGLDESLPLYSDDVDWGWRVNADGGRVVVAPAAVIRHASSLLSGHRRADAVDGRPGAVRRAHGMQVVLLNTAVALVPGFLLRLVAESLLRALAELVLLRRSGGALDELAALGRVLARPHALVSGRARRRGRTRGHRDIRPLLVPASMRWRHLGDAAAAIFGGRAAAEQRRRRRAPLETGPVAEEAEAFDVDDLGVIQRAFRRPGVLLAIGLTVASLVVDRAILGGDLHGGRLLGAPAGASDLWRTYLDGWHPVGLGSTTTAPPALAVVALLSTVLLGKVWLAVDLLVIGAVPLAGLSAYLASGALTRRPALRVPLAVAYALLPAVTGAAVGGRIDVTAAAVLLPLAARACLAAVRADPRRTGWHRAAGAGLLLALVTALVPLIWAVAAPVLLLAALVPGLAPELVPELAPELAPGLVRGMAPARRRILRAIAALGVLAVPVLLLLPWTGYSLRHPDTLVRGLGLPEPLQSRLPVSPAHLLLLHPGGPGQPPWWVLAPLVVAGVVSTAYSRRGVVTRIAMVAFVLSTAAAVAVTRSAGVAAGAPGSRHWAGGLLLVAGLGLLIAVAVAAEDTPRALRAAAFGWRQPGVAVVSVAVAVAAVVVAGHWMVRPDVGAPGTVRSGGAGVLPEFAQAAAQAPSTPRVLALTADKAAVHYAVLRGARGLELGDADVASRPDGAPTATPAGRALDQAVADLAAGRPVAAGEIASFGVTLVIVPADSGGALGRIARVPGLARVPATDTVVYRTSLSAGELTVLAPGDAGTARAGTAAVRTRPMLLDATSGRATTRLPTGPAGRLLVLAEPASPHWRATVGGHRLAPTRAYGWAQAWTLPAGSGQLRVERADDGRGAWMLVELALALLALLLTLPARRLARSGGDGEAPEIPATVTGSPPAPVGAMR
jgi:GT2 family glycosyltransferase